MVDEWEDDLLDKLEEMLRNMGMPINREQLKGFMNQFKDQFDALGINPEKIAKGEVNNIVVIAFYKRCYKIFTLSL